MMQNITAFLTAHPGLNLAIADLFSPEALAQYNWTDGTDRKILLQSLRTHQRLLKIYPDDKVAAKLESLGFHSAHHIAAMGEKAFAQKAMPELAALDGVRDPRALCSKISGNAQRIRRASFELALAKPRTTELAVTDPSGEGTNPDFQKGIPDYQRLFGPMITCDCEECQSIFGPAAYFTDLMRVVTQYVTPPLEELFTLQYRRPDLWTMPLDCHTAETEISYLDIVNGILQQNLQVNYTGGADPLQVLASKVYPFAAPFNQSLLKARAGMEAVGTPLAGLYKLLNVSAPAAAAEMLNLSPEQFSLVTGSHAVSLAQLYGFHDTSISEPDLCDSLSNQKLFLQQTGLRPEQLESLVYQQLKRGEGSYVMQDNGSQNIYTDEFSDTALGGSITIECWVYPTAVYKVMSLVGKGINNEFFIYLDGDKGVRCEYKNVSSESESFFSMEKLNLNAWSHIAWTRDVDTGVNLIYINGVLDSSHSKPAGPALVTDSSVGIGDVADADSLDGAITELRLWSSVRTGSQIKSMMYSRLKNYTEAGLYAYWPLNESGGETAHDLGPHHYDASGSNATFTFYESVPLGGNPENNPVILRNFFLNRPLSDGQYITLTGPDYTAKTGPQLNLSNGSTLATLSDAALSQLAVYIRLQAQTGWTFEELDWVLKSVVSILGIPTQLTVNDTIAESLGQVAGLTRKYQIGIDELSSFWYDMKTYGRGNDALPQDLWDRVFNSPPLMADSGNTAQAVYYRPEYALNPLFFSPVLSWTFKDSTDSQDQRLANQLTAALGISSEDLYAIVQSVITDADTELTLSVPQLSQFYRIARFAKMLNMRVPDFIQLSSIAGIALTDTKLNWTITEVISLCEKAEWMKKARLTIEQLAYLSSSAAPGEGLRLADLQTVDKALSDMRQSAAQVLIIPASFINDRIDSAAAQVIYEQLLASEVIDCNGVVLMNESVLTPDLIYQVLGANPETADQIFPAGHERSYVDFDAGVSPTTRDTNSGESSTPDQSTAMRIELQRISQLLRDTFAAQNLLVAKTLAAVAGVGPDTMSGICSFTSREVDNSAIFTNPPYSPYPYSANMLLNSDSQPKEDRSTYLSVLQRNTAMTRWFKLTGQEAAGIISYSQLLGDRSISYGTAFLSLEQLMTLSDYKSLQSLCNETNGLLDYFRQAIDSGTSTPTSSQLSLLSQLTGWNLAELNLIVSQSYFGDINFNTVAGLSKLADVMAMESKTGTGIVTLNLLRGLSSLNLFESGNESYWQSYTDAASAAMAMLDRKSGDAAVETLNSTLAGEIREALCGWLIWELQTGISGVKNQQELYEYLLIDVNMAPDVKTSWMVAAMNSLQLYVNRIINNLEPGAVNQIPEMWWKWMSTYRVWQANREIYLYPENYVDPTLRKFQSTQFKQFINDISKGQITDDNVKKAFASYLSSVSEIANIDLVDGYVFDVTNAITDKPGDAVNRVFYLIGRSRKKPYTYYCRTAVAVISKHAVELDADPSKATTMNFGAWEPIGLQINSDYLTTATAFGRQFIFWVEQTKVKNSMGESISNSSDKASNSKYTVIYATIYYSCRNFNNSWNSPVVIDNDIIIQVYGESAGDIDYYSDYLNGSGMKSSSGSHVLPFYKEEAWNKVAVQVVPPSGHSAHGILLTLGGPVTCGDSVNEEPTFAPADNLVPEAYNFQVQLYNAASFAWKQKPRFTNILRSYLLDAKLSISQYHVSFDTTNGEFIEGSLVKGMDGLGLQFRVTNNLFPIKAPTPLSEWPAINNKGYVEDGVIIDIEGNEDGTIEGEVTWTEDTFPIFPEVTVAMLENGGFVFDWSEYGTKKYSTISFWFNLNTDSSDDKIIWYTNGLYNIPGANLVHKVGFSGTNKTLYVSFIFQGDTEYSVGLITSKKIISPGTWYLIVITTTPDQVCLYVNDEPTVGIADNVMLEIFDRADSPGPLNFGYFPGMAFDLRFWDVALSEDDVRKLYVAFYLRGMHGNNSLQRLHNSAGCFAFNTGTQSYLVIADQGNHLIDKSLQISTSEDQKTLCLSFRQSPLTKSTLPVMQFIRVNTDTLSDFISELASGGISALLNPDTQYKREESLDAFHPSELARLPDTNLMNFNGAFGVYFWEIFFYAPYLIAEKLRTSQKFDEAEKWFRYIFDPTNQANPVGYWPLNRKLNNNFPDLSGREAATPYNLTSSSEQTPPFSNKPREVWTFNLSASSYLSVPYSKALNSPEFTVAAWINLASVPANGGFYTVACSQSGYTGFHLAIWGSGDGKWCIKLYIGSADSKWIGAYSPDYTYTNKWIYMAGTYNGEHLNVFINGNSVTMQPITCKNYVCNTQRTFSIGSGNSSNEKGNYFDGSIAEVMLFDHALSDGELSQIYKDYPQLWLNSNFWNFRPFRRINAESLYHILNGDAWEESFLQPAQYYSASLQMAVYEYDPFDPDTLARLRINSWQKATVMRYIDNLIGWGDSLFTEDTWETLSDATMRYVLANTLLGRIPVKEVTEDPQPTVNYNSIELEYGTANVPPFLIEMENRLSGLGADATLPEQVQSILNAYFCIPTNKQLLKYWELVADRLYKLRHGLTITGAPNVISLYAAPIDPNALVTAAAGNNLSNVSVPNTVPAIPWFRFSYMISQAKSVTAEVVRLGSELLTALEKKDAEHLAQLQAGYQLVIYNLTNQIKASQINQIQYTGEGLRESYHNAEQVHNTYRNWMLVPVGPLEALSLLLSAESAVSQEIATVARALAVPGFLVPNIYGLADGGMSLGDSLNLASIIMEGEAHLLGATSQMVAQTGQYVRRELEWNLQRMIARNQMKEIAAQIKANDFALEAALTEARLNQTQLRQSQETYQFLKDKFTSEELYDWMSGQLSMLYFQMFQLAWSLAQSAQTALQYELNLNQSYLNPAAWNAGYQGLLSGDALSLALQQMENAYISGNSRKLEIRKTWSMRQNNPQALLSLVSTGNCRFDLNELSYDLDFPGHYNRKIKSLSITIPAVVGPYQNIHATLIQTGNVVVVKPNIAAVEYLLGLTSTAPADGSLRINWNPNQEIAISTGINDAGVFQINFNDEQYLPFEGTGAVSFWSLSIPQASNPFPLRSISDVIVTVEYTAEDGGSTYAAQVTGLAPLQNYKGWQYLSMRQLYSAAWFDFCENPADQVYSLAFELLAQMYPANLADNSVRLGSDTGEIALAPALQEGYTGGLPSFFMNNAAAAWKDETGMLPISDDDEPQPVPGKGNPWTIKAKNVPDGLLSNGKIDQTKLLDIILIIPFTGTLNW